jgi:hypothetical protein
MKLSRKFLKSGTQWEIKYPGISSAFNVISIRIKHVFVQLSAGSTGGDKGKDNVSSKDALTPDEKKAILVDMSTKVKTLISALVKEVGELK